MKSAAGMPALSRPADSAARTVLCFGEILWDELPAGRFPGGAPLNVAYHLHHQGLAPLVVSAVGRDADGEALLQRLLEWGIAIAGIATHPSRPTGTVTASVPSAGEVAYEIKPDVAWDHIGVHHPVFAQAARTSALVFGSLAQRSAANRVDLDALLATLPAAAERVFDVNLRAPFENLERVRALAAQATVLKLNAAEAARLAADEPELPGREQIHARMLQAWCHGSICITAGARGAGLLHDGAWFWEHGREVQVADPVGAGDAFLAGFLAAWLRREDPRACLARGCRLGEWVAAQPGATPAYPTLTHP